MLFVCIYPIVLRYVCMYVLFYKNMHILLLRKVYMEIRLVSYFNLNKKNWETGIISAFPDCIMNTFNPWEIPLELWWYFTTYFRSLYLVKCKYFWKTYSEMYLMKQIDWKSIIVLIKMILCYTIFEKKWCKQNIP